MFIIFFFPIVLMESATIFDFLQEVGKNAKKEEKIKKGNKKEEPLGIKQKALEELEDLSKTISIFKGYDPKKEIAQFSSDMDYIQRIKNEIIEINELLRIIKQTNPGTIKQNKKQLLELHTRFTIILENLARFIKVTKSSPNKERTKQLTDLYAELDSLIHTYKKLIS